MAEPPTLAEELKSLRIDRAAERARAPRWLIAALVIAAIVVLAAVGFRSASDRLFAPEVEVTTVSLVTPAQGAQILVATGYVVPQRKANVSPRIGGRIARIYVDDGSVVKAGQVIAVLEDADYKAQLLQANADYKSAQAREHKSEVELTDAQRSYDREQILQKKGISTPAAEDAAVAKLDSAKAALAGARADTAAAKARVAVAQVNLDNCYVRAPFSGRITQKLSDIGEIVFGFTSAGNTGSGGIASLADFTTLQVEADVSESQVAKLKPGTPADIVLDAFPEKHFRGKVAEVRPKVDRAKATVTVKVAFVDDTTDVLPDMGAKVTFLAKELDESARKEPPVKAVQPDAVVERSGKSVVFAIEPSGTVRATQVVTGPPVGALVSLREGPAAGTRVVRHPPEGLHDGGRVKEKE
jgi:HlyD family secretion protein